MPFGNRGSGLLLAIAVAVMALTKGPVAAPDFAMVAAASLAKTVPRPSTSGRATPGNEAQPDLDEAPVDAAPDECGDGDRIMQEYAALYWPSAPASAFRYLIALVPDPEESGHTDYFDAVLEGIENAAAARALESSADRHVRDRHWLPWARSDKVKRQRRCWEKAPGVIIFRPSESPSKQPGLAVLLVGETPTWGVHPRVLEAALQRADGLLFSEPGRAPAGASGERSSPPQGPPAYISDTHDILGPTFSGSAPSLRALIEHHVHARRERAAVRQLVPPVVCGTFRIASGTATGDDVEQILTSGPGGTSGEQPVPGECVTLSYDSAVPTYGSLLRAMTAFLRQAGGKSALLSEGGTAYGEHQGPGNDSSKDELVHRSFPPNLISLRKAYAEVQSSADQHELPLTRAPSNGNAAPAESRGELSEQTAIAHDLALAEVLRGLSRDAVRNIGIVATDARDVIFIAERVGRQLSDVRIFTIGDDIRYLHPEHAKVLNGLLVAHAAPAGAERHQAHATGAEASQWTATAEQNPMTRSASAAARSLLGRTALEPPPARVSLIGNGSRRQISADLDADGVEHAVKPLVPRSFGLTYKLTILVLMFMLLVIAAPYLALHLSRPGSLNPLSDEAARSAFLRQRGPFWSWWHRIDHRDLAGDEAFATLALVSAAGGALLMMTATLLQLERRSEYYVAIGAVAALVLLFGRACWTRGRHATRSAVVLGIATTVVALTATSLGCSRTRETTLWLLSGASPLIGGLLGMAMLVVVAWCWRTRLRALDLLRFGAVPNTSFSDQKPPVARALGYLEGGQRSVIFEHERRFLQILRSPWSASPLLPLAMNVALLVSVALVHALKPVLTFESGFRHVVLFGTVVACLLPTTTSFARLIVTSSALLRLLRALADPPLLAALSRLPKELARRLESQLVSAGRHASDLVHPVRALGKLAQLDSTRKNRADECAQALDHQLLYEAGVQLGTGLETCPAQLVDRLLDESGALSREREQQPEAVRALSDDFRACLVAIFVGRYVSQMRSLIPPVIVGCVLGILMTSLYFVQPRHLIATACFVWVTVIVLVIIGVYLALARDGVLSAIGGTEAGSVSMSWGLATRVGAVTVVPLASLIASQYPEFAFWLTSVLGSVAQFVQ